MPADILLLIYIPVHLHIPECQCQWLILRIIYFILFKGSAQKMAVSNWLA